MTRSSAPLATPEGDTSRRNRGVQGKLAWQVASRLAGRIMSSGWPVGARLGTESGLLTSLGVSREPFREGVRLLELQGIVRMTRGPHGGLIVTAPAREVVSGLIHGYLELSEITFREVIAARRIIERQAVALAVGRITDEGRAALFAALATAQAAMYNRAARRTAYFNVLRAVEHLADDPCLGIFDQALQHITVDFGLHERLPGHLWSEYSERGYRSLEQLVQAVAAGDAPAGQAAVDALLSRIDDYVHRLDPAEVGLWTTRSFVTGAYLSAGKLLSVADKAGLRLAYRITAQLRRQSLEAGHTIGPEPELIARFGVSRAVFREAVRMLEFFGVVEVRRGKEGGLAVGRMDPHGTIVSALLYLSFAGIEPARTGPLLAILRAADAAAGPDRNRALALLTHVLEAYAVPMQATADLS
jgi:DNA-binding FadR family transcriptional regulator